MVIGVLLQRALHDMCLNTVRDIQHAPAPIAFFPTASAGIDAGGTVIDAIFATTRKFGVSTRTSTRFRLASYPLRGSHRSVGNSRRRILLSAATAKRRSAWRASTR